jgi:hypothetical protein
MKTILSFGCVLLLAACAETNSEPPATPTLTNAAPPTQDCTGVGGPTDPERNEQRLGEEPTLRKGAKKPTCN